MVEHKLFVAPLPHDCKAGDLERLFDDMPGFVEAKVMHHAQPDKAPYGFVTFETADDAEVARVEKDQIKMGPQRLNVVAARPPRAERGVAGGSDRHRDDRPRRDEPRRDDRRDDRRSGGASTGAIDARSMGPYEFKFQDFLRRVRQSPADNEPATLIVKQLPYDITERELMHVFRPFAGFKSVTVVAPKDTHDTSPRRVCFVVFSHKLVADFAMQQLDGYDFDGNGGRILVQIADKDRKPRDRDGGARGGGGGRDRDRDRSRDRRERERPRERETRVSDTW